ncbi:hypothetical protein B0H14DRAFT_3441654 [Mycena olivaceomarginata]|nr:hypothetical protein B0H14DRAFT_3441654 [Mycena olivaceomarginata]
MLSTAPGVPMLPEADKFDEMGWAAWKTKISAHIKAHGLGGYINGTIPNPRPDAENLAANVADLIALPPESRVVYLRTPSSDEWDYCDGITTSILVLNVKDPIGVGLKTNGSAYDAWKSLVDIYAHQTDMAISCVLRDLNTTYYAPGIMCKLHRAANNFGTNITDGVFRMTFIASLGEPWRHVTPVLRTYNTSAKVINFLIEEEQAHNGNNLLSETNTLPTSASSPPPLELAPAPSSHGCDPYPKIRDFRRLPAMRPSASAPPANGSLPVPHGLGYPDTACSPLRTTHRLAKGDRLSLLLPEHLSTRRHNYQAMPEAPDVF